MKVITFLVLCTTILSVNVNSKSYEGYKLFKIIPENENELNVLESIRDNGVGLFWVEYFSIGTDVRIIVDPDQERNFLDYLSKGKIDYEIVFDDLQNVIDQGNPNYRNIRSENTFHSLSWDVYHNLDDINAWISKLSEVYSDVVTPIVMGISVEGREILGMKIDFKPDRPHRNIGVIEGTLHAREWIAPATVTWIVKEFLTSTDPAVRAMAEDLEWHIFPVVNPDGYVYSFTHDRMWRKNRSTASFKTCPGATADDISNGVDLNRNFGFVWMTAGASNDSCTQTYAGPSAFSEPESQAISSYMTSLSNGGNIIYYIAFHSYTQLIVIPYSHVSGYEVLAADNYGDMYEIAIRGAEKLSQRYGTTYRVGVSADVLYVMSGTSFDWVKYNTNTKISFLMELRDLGQFGFLLPASQIIPNCEEVMDGLLEMDKTTRMLGYYHGDSSAVVYSLYLVMFGLVTLLFSN